VTRIRDACREDAENIGRIHVETWRDCYAGLLPDRALVRMSADIEGGRWARCLDGGERVVVADTDEGQMVGFGSCGVSRNRALPFGGEVYTLYVLPDYQGQGIGRRLLNGLFGGLAACGHRSAVIWVLRLNPSRYFYEAMGGRHVADRDERVWGSLVGEAAYGWESLPVPCSPR
jgi:GNAT superfamily N-acetyltransferase